ncbi:PQQ-like beta-propeller repeat protein [Actinomadura sp. ATCC 31491]|uniref:PQQ-like beta-propeller repeat protein n=1 Tax=Actinomadura luzonensis TaxID=2805427 RepID=A0ABT0G1B7_9ACTN|nr:PQQ-binding-like beta-propeller repeat protein [Actinomadura luzonensis]MCK2218397.1 PQQ-like beta-propeller repeat protein [Actinomadura luzonensis]
MLGRVRVIHVVSCAVVSVLLLGFIGLPGETITAAGRSSYPWRPAGWGTPAIDVVGSASYAAEVYGDVAVRSRWGPRDAGLVGERVTDGATAWRYENAWADDSLGPVRVDDRRVAAVWRDGRVSLIDVPDGRIVWRADLPSGPYHEANRAYDEEWAAAWEISVAADGPVPLVVVLHDGRLDVLDGRTGESRWSYPQGPPVSCPERRDLVPSSVRSAGGVVLVFGECAGGEANLALSAADGGRLWEFRGGELWHARALGAGRLASVDAGGALSVRAARDGKVLWRVPSAGLERNPYGEAMGVSDDLVIVRSPAAATAYRIADGGVAWRRALDETGDHAVLTDGARTYVAADATTLLRLDTGTGRVVDRRRFADDITLRWAHDGLAGIGVGIGDDVVVA